MKNLILILLLGMFAFSSFGQTAVKKNNMHFSLGGGAADTLIESETLVYPVYFEGSEILRYRVHNSVDSTSGTPSFSTYIQGSSNNITWTDIDTVIYTTGVDTTYDFVNTTGVDYKHLRLYNVATATAQKSTFKSWWTFWFKQD